METLFIIGLLILAALALASREKDDGKINNESKAVAAAYSYWIDHIDPSDNGKQLDFECLPYYSEPGSFFVAMWRYDEEYNDVYNDVYSTDMIVRQDGRVRIVS